MVLIGHWLAPNRCSTVQMWGTHTTGLGYFAECHRHSAKSGKHSATTLPSVAHGEVHMAFHLLAKPALPSALSQALGKLLPCAKSHSAKKVETGWANGTAERDGGQGLCRVPDAWHSAKIQSLPSAKGWALSEVLDFAECCHVGTRRSLELCRVSTL